MLKRKIILLLPLLIIVTSLVLIDERNSHEIYTLEGHYAEVVNDCHQFDLLLTNDGDKPIVFDRGKRDALQISVYGTDGERIDIDNGEWEKPVLPNGFTLHPGDGVTLTTGLQETLLIHGTYEFEFSLSLESGRTIEVNMPLKI